MIKPENKGERIHCIAQLMDLAKARKSVIAEHRCLSDKPCPAAFAINMQAWRLHHIIVKGLYVYKKVAK